MIVYNLPAGKLKVFTLTGTIDVLFLDLLPDEGTFWKVIAARMRTDDAVARNVYFEFYNGTTHVPVADPVNLVAGFPRYLNFTIDPLLGVIVPGVLRGDVWITHNTYLRVVIAVLTAGKKLFIDACVEEVVGLEARA
jgi:hypothetical protein